MRILIVDDEDNIRSVLKEYLEVEQYEIDEADNGEMALEMINNNDYDLMILDIMMPKMDGFSLLKSLDNDKLIPTIMLSARDQEYDKLEGFELGVDDYVTKPFSPKEVVARVKAILSRTSTKINDIYTLDTLEINKLTREIKIDNKKIEVTPKEFDILIYLIENKNMAISREQLLSKLWGYDFFGDDRTVDTHIKMLRANLGKYRNHIITIRGIGYRFIEDKDEK